MAKPARKATVSGQRGDAKGSGGRGDAATVAAVVVLSCVFLLVAAYPRQWTLGLLINDEYWHAQLARNLYEGRGYVSNVLYPLQAPSVDAFPVPEPMKQPGFELLTALAWLVTGESIRAMLSVALVGMAVFAGAIYLLARRLGWGNGPALFAVGATVLHPVMAQYGVQALPESLYFACFTLTVLLVLRGGTADIVAAGALNAALMLIKGHGLIYVPLFAAFLWLRGAGSSLPKHGASVPKGGASLPNVGSSVPKGGSPPPKGGASLPKAGSSLPNEGAPVPRGETAGARLLARIRPSPAKLRAAGSYVLATFVTLLLAWLLLPGGSVQLFEASGTYSHGLLIEVGRITSDVPYLSVEPPAAWSYIAEHPGEYLGKVARMVRRTKIMIDALSGPAMAGVLFPALLLSCLLLVADAVAPGKLLPPTREAEAEPYLLFAAIIGWTLLAFWPVYLSARFIAHTLPLMLLICMYTGTRLGHLVHGVRPALRKTALAATIVYFVAYPAAVTLWDSYRDPMRLIGSLIAVRHLDYTRMAGNVETLLPDDPVIVSDMPHEIVWLTESRAIAFPNTEEDLAYLVARYDVDALYEHPLFPRDWPLIREQFALVDNRDGALWVRRRDRERPR